MKKLAIVSALALSLAATVANASPQQQDEQQVVAIHEIAIFIHHTNAVGIAIVG